MKKFSYGDKVFYVDKKSDSEVEAYIYRDMGDDIYMVKLRHAPSFGFFPWDRLTKIDPETWESLEDNLKDSGVPQIELSDDESESIDK